MADDRGVLIAFLVCLLAGLATAIGGLLALQPRLRRPSGTAVALGFAGGAMIAVSLVEIVPRSYTELAEQFSGPTGVLATALAVLAGAGVVWLVTAVLPHSEQVDPAHTAGCDMEAVGSGAGPAPETTTQTSTVVAARTMRSGVLVAAVVTLHNVPEGMSTYLATLADPALGITLAVAIAIHNIPEGIAVATPVLAATGSKAKAVGWATVSGLAEPLGAVVAMLLVQAMLPQEWFSLTFGLIAGMMITISVRELLPVAWRYQPRLAPILTGALAGGAVMVLSLALFG